MAGGMQRSWRAGAGAPPQRATETQLGRGQLTPDLAYQGRQIPPRFLL